MVLKRDGDAADFDPSPMRRDRDGSGVTIGLGRSGPRLTLRGEHVAIIVVLVIMIFYLLGAFERLGVISPLKNGSATYSMQATAEHREIIDEMQISQYILAECLRSPDRCPRLSLPRRLQERLTEPQPERRHPRDR